MIVIQSESLRAIISSNVFSVPFFNLLFFCDDRFLCWYAWRCPWVLRLCSFFFHLFFCLVFRLGWFSRSVFTFIDSSTISRLLLRSSSGTSLVVQRLRPVLAPQRAQVWLLVGELRSCMLCSMAKKEKDPSCYSFMAIPTPALPTPENYEEMLSNSIIVISRKWYKRNHIVCEHLRLASFT